MAETIFKTFRAEVKGINAETGEVDMFIPVSSDEWDRDQEVIEPTAVKKTLPKFMKHPVLVASHDYRDLTNQIGEWTKLRVVEKGVEGKPKYYVNEGNEQADWGFKLASKGMAAFSFGFIPNPEQTIEGDGIKTPRRTYKEIELLEISQVIVPSNREAIQGIRSKSVDPIITKLYDDILKDKELITKPEETDEYIRIPVRGEAGKHEDHRIRTITISEKDGIKALYCGECKVVITYLFAKDHDWTMASAREWMKEHSKNLILVLVADSEAETVIHKPAEVSQNEILDELDYLIRLIDTEGMNDDVKKDAWNLVREVLRLSGSDIPVDIREIVIGDSIPITVIADPVIETLTNLDILDAIKRITGN